MNTQPLIARLASSQMRNAKLILLVASTLLVLAGGCRQPASNAGGLSFNPVQLFGRGASGSLANNTGGGIGASSFGGGGLGNPILAQNQSPQNNNLAGQLQQLNQRLGAFDSDNQLLNTQVATLEQRLQLADQYNSTLRQQLADTSTQIQQAETARRTAQQQLASAQAQIQQLTRGNQGQLAGFGGSSTPSRLAGGATIRANNSLTRQLADINIPGGQARMDGDVIRIEFPSDRLFVPGTFQIQPAQLPLLQNITRTIGQSFPRQIVGVEAHWDNTPLNPPNTSHHQLTATQALSVVDNLVRLGVPQNQLFIMAVGSNRPRHPQGISGGISPNRRIELVIYPETFDGS